MTTPKRPWPGDAVMIVCAERGTENRANMEAPVDVVCRDCLKPLSADSKTISFAAKTYTRHGRPVKFFCVACAMEYDPHSVDKFADHSSARDGANAFAMTKAEDLEIVEVVEVPVSLRNCIHQALPNKPSPRGEFPNRLEAAKVQAGYVMPENLTLSVKYRDVSRGFDRVTLMIVESVTLLERKPK